MLRRSLGYRWVATGSYINIRAVPTDTPEAIYKEISPNPHSREPSCSLESSVVDVLLLIHAG